MDPSDDPGVAAGPDASIDAWIDAPPPGEHGVPIRAEVVTDHAPASLRRPLVNIVIGLVLVALLVAVNGTWSPARAVQQTLEVITDYEPPAADAPPPASAPQVTTPGYIATTTTVAPAPVVTEATAPAPVEPTTTVESPVAVPVEPVPAATPEVTDPALVSRPIPAEPPPVANPVTSPWADRTRTTPAGYVATDVGCASGTSTGALDAFFSQRIGPVIGHDYQHVYPLGGSRYLWLFQDTFVDYSGTATSLGQASFDHNTALVQDGACFTLYHRGTIASPTSFENGTGESRLAKWFWPMGGQTFGGKVYVFWAEMQKDGYEPSPPNGLGWHPSRTWLAVYDANTLARLSFSAAPNSGVRPIYGYAVDSDAEYTYLFGNTFEQNLQREGGYFNGPHSGTEMWLARVPLGQFGASVEYRTADGWTYDAAAAVPITQRYWAENPMQPRYLNGQWVSVTKVNGYWGDSLSVDVANDPWGPWTTTQSSGLSPRGGDPLMNTYHAYLMPWLDGGGLSVSISQNARNMERDAWPNPARYRLAFFRSALVAPPPREEVPPETSTTVADTSTTVVETSTTVEATTTVPPTTTIVTTPPTPPTEPPPVGTSTTTTTPTSEPQPSVPDGSVPGDTSTSTTTPG